MRIYLILAILLLSSSQACQADDQEGLDLPSREALQKTQNMLLNPALRKEAIRGDKDAMNANEALKNAVGTQENMEKVFAITSSVFQKIVIENGGDVAKITEAVEKLQRNPASLEPKLSSDQIAQLHEMASKLEMAKEPPGSNATQPHPSFRP